MKKKQKVGLTCMLAEDMYVAHPKTNWDHVCNRCKLPVGVYPSGQKVLKRRDLDVEIICNRCVALGELVGAMPASKGILQEVKDSIPIPKR